MTMREYEWFREEFDARIDRQMKAPVPVAQRLHRSYSDNLAFDITFEPVGRSRLGRTKIVVTKASLLLLVDHLVTRMEMTTPQGTVGFDTFTQEDVDGANNILVVGR